VERARQIAEALTRAGIERLPPPARAHLARRLAIGFAAGEDSAFNPAGLRDTTFGCARSGSFGLARFKDINSGASAAVANAFRAAPRDWGATDKALLSRLGSYPIHRNQTATSLVPIPTSDGSIRYGSVKEAESSGATRNADGSWNLSGVRVEGTPIGEFKWSYLIPGYGPYALVRDYFRPSEEAEATFRGLVADWEAYERLGVGERTMPEARDDLIAWRKFRDEWRAGSIPGNETGGRLNAQVAISNMVRRGLKDQGAVDPILQQERKGVDVERSTEALADSAKTEQFCKGVPFCEWMTKPGQVLIETPFGPMPKNIAIAGGVGIGVLGLIAITGAVGAVRG
jgi:hypothetical protein